MTLLCDWCREPIEERDYATIEPGGNYHGGKGIRMRPRTYHTSHEYSNGSSEYCCFAHALRLLNGNDDFHTPDAGMEWKLVPASESHHHKNPYTSPALGTTPLAELGLTQAVYQKLTKRGVFTVEHLVDARTRGDALALGVRQLERVDATLLERGLIPTGGETREAGSC